MPIPVRTQAAFWGAALSFFLLFVWLFKGVLTPFILGIAIAYLLNPIVVLFSKIGVRRWLSSLFILFLFIMTVTVITVLIIPPLYRELSDLVQKIPDYLDSGLAFAMPYVERVQAQLGVNGIEEFKTLLKTNAGKLFTAGSGLLAGLASGGQAFASFLTTAILTPIVAYFMMKEWPKTVSFLEDLYPKKNADTIKLLLTKIDHKIAGFVRGQLMVAIVLGLIYAVVLSLLDLNYGFLIGLSAGVAGIIPLVGSTLGLIVSVVVAWLQTGEIGFTGLIAGVFIIGQLLEANVLTPKLIGDSVGLHPLWIIFALLAGGSLFGIPGMLLAVPVTAATGVLLGYVIERYKGSRFFDNIKSSKKTVSVKKAAIKASMQK